MDERLLLHHYTIITPAYSQSFIRALLSDEAHPLRQYLSTTSLLQFDHKLLQIHTLEAVIGRKNASFDVGSILPELMQSVPSRRTNIPGFSTTMLFTYNLLREVADGKAAGTSARTILHSVESLLRLVRKKRLGAVRLQEIMGLAIQMLQSRSAAIRSLGAHKGGLLYHIVQCWSREPEAFDAVLISILQVLNINANELLELYKAIKKEIQPSQHWLLLHTPFPHNKNLQADIKTIKGLGKLRSVRWTCELFLELQKDKALPLLQKLIAIYPDADFLEAKRGLTIFAHPPALNSSIGDPRLLLNFLERSYAGALDHAQNIVSDKGRKSATSRAFFARSALLYAIASGSLPIYGETIIWARRFSRDFLTSKTLYAKSTTNTIEGIALLSGIPPKLSRQADIIDVGRRVTEANAIISTFSEAYSGASKEPHLKQYDWQGPLGLLTHN